MKDPAGGVCKEEAAEEEEEGGRREEDRSPRGGSGGGPGCRIEDLRKVNSAEKRSIIVFLEQPPALQLEVFSSRWTCCKLWRLFKGSCLSGNLTTVDG
ncbi:uncharacterized protein AAES06_016584 isoform 2-T3 [Glossophaga mutica]